MYRFMCCVSIYVCVCLSRGWGVCAYVLCKCVCVGECSSRGWDVCVCVRECVVVCLFACVSKYSHVNVDFILSFHLCYMYIICTDENVFPINRNLDFYETMI